MHGQDRLITDRLLASPQPSDADIVDCARLLMRYQGFPGARDIQTDLATALSHWRLDVDQLFKRSRKLWENGWRPQLTEDQEIGSGADVSAA